MARSFPASWARTAILCNVEDLLLVERFAELCEAEKVPAPEMLEVRGDEDVLRFRVIGGERMLSRLVFRSELGSCVLGADPFISRMLDEWRQGVARG